MEHEKVEPCDCEKFQSDEFLICFKHGIWGNMFVGDWYRMNEIDECYCTNCKPEAYQTGD